MVLLLSEAMRMQLTKSQYYLKTFVKIIIENWKQSECDIPTHHRPQL